MNIIKKIKNKIQEWKDNRWNPYCPLCSSCGEEGCCSPISCMFKCMVDEKPKKCHYGEAYAEDLWFSYLLAEMYGKYNYKLKKKEITLEEYLEITEKEWNELYEIAYAESIKRNREYNEKCNIK